MLTDPETVASPFIGLTNREIDKIANLPAIISEVKTYIGFVLNHVIILSDAGINRRR
jgi:hypothetical protein